MGLLDYNTKKTNLLVRDEQSQRYLDEGRAIAQEKLAGVLYPEIYMQDIADDDYIEMGRQRIKEKTKRTLGGTIKDVAVSSAKGVVGLGEAAVGLADIPTLGRVGKGMEKYLGYDPAATQEFLGKFYSPAQKAAFEKVEKAKGFLGTTKAMLQHPSTIGHAVVESAPQMLGGAAAARKLIASGMLKMTPAWKNIIAASIGEGLVSAGATAEGIRQQTEDGVLTPKQAAISAISGAGTALFAVVGGRVAQKFGIIDPDTFLAGGSNVTSTGVIKRIIGGGITEGAFEELPQSMQEQVWLNAALDKPLLEGVGEAGATGTLTGFAMGAGFNIFTGKPYTKAEKETTATPDEINQVKADIKSGLISEGIKSGDLTSEMMAPAIERIATQDPALAKQLADMFVVKETDLSENERRFEEDPLDAENNAEFLDKYIKKSALSAENQRRIDAIAPEYLNPPKVQKLPSGFVEDSKGQIIQGVEKKQVEFIGMQERVDKSPLPLVNELDTKSTVAYDPDKHEMTNLPEYEKAVAGEKVEKAVKEVVSEIDSLIESFEATGHTATRYPRKKQISVDGRAMNEKEAIAKMRRVVESRPPKSKKPKPKLPRTEDLEGEGIGEPTSEQSISQAYEKLSKGERNTRVRISDIKAETGLDQNTLSKTLKEMQTDNQAVLYPFDMPSEITRADKESAVEVGGEPSHIVFMKAEVIPEAKPKVEKEPYRHRPMTVEVGAARLDDLTPAFGEDIYTKNAVQYFGTGDKAIDRETVKILQSLKGKPEQEVSVYRSVEVDVKVDKLVEGDWVTINKEYAKQHGESILEGNYKIIEQKVKAQDLTTNADSFNEQGYYPVEPKVEKEKVEVTPEKKIAQVPTENLSIDATRFQFKRFLGKGGVSSTLKSIKKYDPDLGGLISVWKDPSDNKTYVINGHHRYELAKRTGQKGITVNYLEAANAGEAKLKGALINIAEGQGTPEDAAVIFRQNNIIPEEVEAKYGISLKGSIAQEGMALSGLSPEIFNKVEVGEFPRNWGVVIGEKLRNDFDAQNELAKLIKKEGKKKHISTGIIEQVINDIQGVEKRTETQKTLFGDEIKTRPLLIERAELRDYAINKLLSDKRLFGIVSKEEKAARLREAGNIITAEENKKLSEEAGTLATVLNQLASHKGPINDTINEYAKELANAADKTQKDSTKQRFLESVQDAIRQEVPKIQKEVSEGDIRYGEGRETDTGVAEEQVEGFKPKPKLFGGKELIPKVKPAKKEKLAALGKVKRKASSQFKQDSMFGPNQMDLFGEKEKPHEKEKKEKAEALPGPEGRGAVYTKGKVETRFPEIISDRAGSYSSGVKTIIAPKDAAAFAHLNLAKYPQEHLAILILDKNHEIISVHRHSIGSSTSSVAMPSVIAGQALNTPGAASIILVHNHPNNVPELSKSDVGVFEAIKNLLEKSKVKTHDMIAVTTDKYSSYLEGWDTSSEIPKVQAKHEIPMMERVFKSKGENLYRINNSEKATDFGNANLPEGGLILMNNAKDVIGVVPMQDYSLLRGDASEKILKQAEATNANCMIAFNPQGNLKNIINLKKFANAANFALLDVIDKRGSHVEMGVMPVTDEKKFFATKATKPQETITRKDLRKIFKRMKHIRTGQDSDGNLWFKAEGRPKITIFELDNITGHLNTSAGQIPVGSYLRDTIELKTGGEGHTADIGTAYHEFFHWLSKNGIISANDITALNRVIAKARGISESNVTEEHRAYYVGDNISAWETQKHPRIRRILRKLTDFMNAIYDFAAQAGWVKGRERTAEGVLRDISSGEILAEKKIASERAGELIPAYQMAGTKAIGAPTGQLVKAQEMLAEGKDKKEVWRETGWLFSKEGKWKFEVDDSGAKLKDLGLGKQIHKLGDVLDHPKLYEAYPKLKEIRVHSNMDTKDNWTSGSYFHGEGLEGEILSRNRIMLDGNPNKAMEYIHHEVAHAVQNIEGFAKGGSPKTMKTMENVAILAKGALAIKKKAISDSISEQKAMSLLKSEGASFTNDMLFSAQGNNIASIRKIAKGWTGLTPQEAYEHLLGEIEARDTEARAKLTPEQRREQMPYESQGIPEDQWIITDGKGTSFSISETKQFATKPTKDYRDMLKRYQVKHTTPLVDETVDKTKIKHFDNLEKTSSQPDWIKDKFGREEKTLKEKIGDNVGAFRKNWQTRLLDRLHPIKALGETAYMLHRLETGAQATMAMFMRHGKLKWEGKALTIDTQKQGFMPWLDSLGDDAQKLFYWMAAKRAEVLETEGREKWLDTDTRKKIFDWVGEKPKSAKSWRILNNQFQDFNKSVLNLAQQSGLINPIKRAAWEQEFYVPFYRIFEDAVAREEFLKGPLMGKKHISAQIKRLLGAEMKIGDPLENVIRNWSHLIHESVRNMARAEAYDYAQKNKIKSSMIGEGDKLMPLIETVKASELNIYRSDKEKRMVYVTKKGDDNILSFQKNGRRIYFKVNDIEMFNALGDVNHRQFNGFLVRACGQAKRWLTYGATFGPAFKVANMLRDSLHTAIISKSFIPFIDSGKGIVKALREDADYVKFMASGAGFGSSYIRAENPQALAEYINRIVKKEGGGSVQRILDTPKKMLDFWEKLGAASENAARVQLYTKRIAEGETHLKAAFEGRDLMDFTMRGDSQVVQYLIRTVPFMNARAQGLYKLGRAAKQDPKSFMVKGSILTIATLALWAINRDKDEWKELEDWDKRTYYHFWIGSKHYRIPKPFETGAIFSTVFEGMAEVMSGDEEFGYFVDVIKDTFLDTFAMNPLPQAVRPLIEQWSNKSFFTGRPIEGQSLQRLKPGERKTAWTSETMQLAGKLGVSPKRAEEIIRGYFSTFGMFLLGISDIFSYHLADFPVTPTKEINDYPLLGRFIKERVPARHTKYQTKFYEMFREIDQLVATVNNHRRLGNYKEATALATKERKNFSKRKGLLKVRKELTEINARLRRTMASRVLTADQKRTKIDGLVERKNKETKRIYERYLE